MPAGTFLVRCGTACTDSQAFHPSGDSSLDLKILDIELKYQPVLNAPVTVHFPWLNGVEVADDRAGVLKEVRLDAPEFGDFGNGRLHLALIVRRSRLKKR